MRKAGIIVLAGIVLLGCIFAAGCTAGDPVVGVWTLTDPTELGAQETDGYDTIMTIERYGNGYQSFYGADEKYESTDSSSSYAAGSSASTSNFSWVNNNDGTYTLSFPGEDDVTATYNAKTQSLTTNWGTYTKLV